MRTTKRVQTYVVYCITHVATGRHYIGYTKNYRKRMEQQHFNPFYRKEYSDKLLYLEMDDHGQEKFKKRILIRGLLPREVRYAEAYIINNYKTYPPYGFNVNREREYLKARIAIGVRPKVLHQLRKLNLKRKDVTNEKTITRNTSSYPNRMHPRSKT